MAHTILVVLTVTSACPNTAVSFLICRIPRSAVYIVKPLAHRSLCQGLHGILPGIRRLFQRLEAVRGLSVRVKIIGAVRPVKYFPSDSEPDRLSRSVRLYPADPLHPQDQKGKKHGRGTQLPFSRIPHLFHPAALPFCPAFLPQSIPVLLRYR